MTSIIADVVCNFEIRFSDLVRSVQNEMLRAQVSVKHLRHTVTLLPTSIKMEHNQFIKEYSEDFKIAEDIGDIFRHLNVYWTYLEYSLLDHIFLCHSNSLSVELKDKMKLYKYDMTAFKRSTTVEQILEVGLGARREPPPGFSHIVSKLSRNPYEYTLEELNQFRHGICHELSLTTFILTLESFQEG